VVGVVTREMASLGLEDCESRESMVSEFMKKRVPSTAIIP
jgi:hypothetical protein